MKKHTTTLFLAIFSAIFIWSCSNQTETKESTAKQPDTLQLSNFQLKDQQQDQLLKSYLNLKDALVLSDAAKAQSAAQQLLNELKQDKTLENAAKMTDSIAIVADIAKQRQTFTNLSNALIPVFRKAALAKGAFYVQFCPMANEGNGGYWLAAEEEVRNPYYGDEMLNCGEVKETIK